jgi:Tfp pilus assembly protein PilX
MKNAGRKNKKGATTLILAVILMVSATIITLYAASYGLKGQAISANTARSLSAFEAAEAGLEYGINYLNQNSALILASPSAGHIQPYTSVKTTNVVLANQSKFSIVYSNPIANNYTLILITSTGLNDDGTATKTVSQLVQHGSLLFITPPNPLINIANVQLRSGAIVQNTQSNITIQSGGSTTLTSSAKTVLSTGTSSNASFIGSDIQQNLAPLAATSSTNLVASYFGLTPSAAKTKANYVFSNLGNYNTALNGLTGTTIWIDQTSGYANIYSNTQVGTVAAPVLLFMNGNLVLQNQAMVVGMIVLLGNSTSVIADQAQVIGSIISINNVILTDNSFVNFNNNVLNALQNVTNTYYAKVPGSWKDF